MAWNQFHMVAGALLMVLLTTRHGASTNKEGRSALQSHDEYSLGKSIFLLHSDSAYR